MVLIMLVIAAGLLLVVAIVALLLLNRSWGNLPTVPPVPPPLAPNLGTDLETEAQHFLQRGQKIQAIKLVRDRTGMGLKEAKDWVESLERGASPSTFPQSAPAQTDPAADLETAVQQLLQRGQKIQAIKLVRERTGIGLKEAKDWVESLERR